MGRFLSQDQYGKLVLYVTQNASLLCKLKGTWVDMAASLSRQVGFEVTKASARKAFSTAGIEWTARNTHNPNANGVKGYNALRSRITRIEKALHAAGVHLEAYDAEQEAD